MSFDFKLPFEPKILADSTNWTKFRLTTFLIPIPTCLLAELRTHRLLKWTGDINYNLDFSINANSDRAIPIEKKIENILEFPYIPIPSKANRGMTAIEETNDYFDNIVTALYKESMYHNIAIAKELSQNGASKQYVNRLLMPYSWSYVVITGDNLSWQHFFRLRTTKDVEPNFRHIALSMNEIYYKSKPNFLEINEWHIPFKDELFNISAQLKMNLTKKEQLSISASCCARISYNIERNETLEKHLDRARICFDYGHYSVFEHQAKVPTKKEFLQKQYNSNVKGWILNRKLIELEDFEKKMDYYNNSGIFCTVEDASIELNYSDTMIRFFCKNRLLNHELVFRGKNGYKIFIYKSDLIDFEIKKEKFKESNKIKW